MSLIQRIKSVLGLNGSAPREEEGPVAVTVEHEPETATEAGEVDQPQPETEFAEAPTGAGEVEDAPTETEPAEPDPEGPTHDGPVTEISGIGPSYSERLAAAGVTTIGELARADAEELGQATELSANRISGWIESAKDLASGD